MKKIFTTIIIVLFTSTCISYAGIYRDSATNSEGSSGYGIFYVSNTGNSEENSCAGGLFRSSESDPGDRPGSGDGIGQEAPLGDMLYFLSICCSIYVIVKFSSRKRDKKYCYSLIIRNFSVINAGEK